MEIRIWILFKFGHFKFLDIKAHSYNAIYESTRPNVPCISHTVSWKQQKLNIYYNIKKSKYFPLAMAVY